MCRDLVSVGPVTPQPRRGHGRPPPLARTTKRQLEPHDVRTETENWSEWYSIMAPELTLGIEQHSGRASVALRLGGHFVTKSAGEMVLKRRTEGGEKKR